MKSPTKKVLHKILFKRALKYKSQPELEINYTKTYIESRDKKICILTNVEKKSDSPIVILAHPYLSEAKLFYIKNGHADMYRSIGISVVLLDFNGFGESPFVNFRFEDDIEMTAEWISEKYPHRKIIIHGISFGASHTITYGKFPQNIAHKTIIENCLDSNLSYYKKRNRKIYLLTKLLMTLYPRGNKNHDYVSSIKEQKNIKKTLLIYNDEDDLTTLEMGQNLKNACNIPQQFEIFHGKHLNALKESPDRYRDIIKKFIFESNQNNAVELLYEK